MLQRTPNIFGQKQAAGYYSYSTCLQPIDNRYALATLARHCRSMAIASELLVEVPPWTEPVILQICLELGHERCGATTIDVSFGDGVAQQFGNQSAADPPRTVVARVLTQRPAVGGVYSDVHPRRRCTLGQLQDLLVAGVVRPVLSAMYIQDGAACEARLHGEAVAASASVHQLVKHAEHWGEPYAGRDEEDGTGGRVFQDELTS